MFWGKNICKGLPKVHAWSSSYYTMGDDYVGICAKSLARIKYVLMKHWFSNFLVSALLHLKITEDGKNIYICGLESQVFSVLKVNMEKN